MQESEKQEDSMTSATTCTPFDPDVIKVCCSISLCQCVCVCVHVCQCVCSAVMHILLYVFQVTHGLLVAIAVTIYTVQCTT